MKHSTTLRVIGQKLEPLGPATYEVVAYGSSYLVRCRVREENGSKKEKERQVRGLASFLRLWKEPETPVGPENWNQETFMNVEFLYSVEELDRHNAERKKPRTETNTMPDPYSISNVLRAVGEFLDRKADAKLLFATKHGQEVVILYETKRGDRNLEQFPIATLYDYVVKQYVKRKK
jgi:hypothetical protein